MTDQNSMEQAQELAAKLAELVRDAATDQGLMGQLMGDWRRIVEERDIDIPSEVELVFLPNRKNLWFLPVPFSASGEDGG